MAKKWKIRIPRRKTEYRKWNEIGSEKMEKKGEEDEDEKTMEVA
jgi:hypothetical protein